KNVKDIQSFLGCIGYYRKFIKDFGQKAAPLTKLICKDVLWNWTDSCEKAFSAMKDAMTNAPILGQPDYSKQFIIYTDACVEGLGAVLQQKCTQTDGEKQKTKEVVICYI